MDKRITIINIIVEKKENAIKVNSVLHDFSQYIVARMGVPYAEKDVSVICIVADIPQKESSALSGKLGMIDGVTAKTMTAKL